MTAVLATVSGLDGSGKSTFGRRLAALCGGDVTVLSVDDVRRPVSWSQPGRSEAEIYYEDYFALDELEARVAAAPGPVIVEGVFVLRVPALAAAFAIYLEVELALARARILERDIARGRTVAEVHHRMDERYFPAQARYAAAYDPRGRADAIIDNNLPERPRLLHGDPLAWPPSVAAPLTHLLSA